MPCSAQNCSAFDLVRVCPAVKRIAALWPCTAPTRVRPQRPSPTIAARIIRFPFPQLSRARGRFFYTHLAVAVTRPPGRA